MKKIVIKFKDGSHINITADSIEFEKGMVFARNGTKLVAIARIKEIISCYISIQN